MKNRKEIGIVKSYVEDKGYGFIRKEKDSVFFHKNDLKGLTPQDIHIGTVLSFEEIPTAKGNKAVNIELADAGEFRYEVPSEYFFFNLHNRIPDSLVVMDRSDFKISFTIRDPSRKLSEFTRYLRYAEGANAIFDIEHSTSTRSEMSNSGNIGAHKYTVHHFSGRIGRVGRINTKGTPLSELPDVNNNLYIRYSEELNRKKKNQTALGIFLVAVAAVMIILSLLMQSIVPAVVAVIGGSLLMYLCSGNDFLDHILYSGEQSKSLQTNWPTA
ncbi:cold-shock protein [Succinivibrio dextrinosolvens]|jgi:cold shock CspA family protein|uniref:cold-shock protein n=1 Tax=Succinivibrio dextrinosolvens TaxID=83771 RepID=UPI00241D7055|nr:cold shock domain-containing protein [Succinivibrio dextrinosolvens]MBE6423071.1 cold shock domain-containing protein [Succinivibrio dextrinosolvens]